MTTSTVNPLLNAEMFPRFNVAEYPARDGVRFSIALRKELELAVSQQMTTAAPRALFTQVFVRLGKTSAHASNYWQKTNNERAGIDMHATNKKWAAKKQQEKRVETVETPAEVVSVESAVDLPVETVVEPVVQVETTPVVHNRWIIVNKDTKEIVDSFTSRTQAQKVNDELKKQGQNTKWDDLTKFAN
jgi:hypothetical protein